MKTIKLFGGQLAEVDDDDFEELNQYKWSMDSHGYPKSDFRSITIKMHRAVIGKPPSGEEIHHKDGNKLNNQKSNLEFVVRGTHQRSHNLLRECTTKLGYKGVEQHGAKFQAYAKKNNKRIHLGTSDTPEGAARLRNDHDKLNSF
jgi:hypothetical protein